jgi:hypothetical protein
MKTDPRVHKQEDRESDREGMRTMKRVMSFRKNLHNQIKKERQQSKRREKDLLLGSETNATNETGDDEANKSIASKTRAVWA